MSVPSDQELISLLHGRGQRVTPQRLVILRELRRLGGHISAEHIHRAVGQELPGTSVPTVYATLDLLVELGLARKLDIGAGRSLYDARTDPHGHLVCRDCGGIFDVELALDTGGVVRAAQRQGFAADDVQLVLGGRCRACRATG